MESSWEVGEREKDEMSQDSLEYQYLKDEQEKSHQGR